MEPSDRGKGMTVRLLSGVTIHDSGDQAILLGTGKDAAYWRLNGMAKQMVTQLLAGNEVDTVVAAVVAETDADGTVVRQDVEALVASLVDARLVEVTA